MSRTSVTAGDRSGGPSFREGAVATVVWFGAVVSLAAQNPTALRLLDEADRLERRGEVAATLPVFEDVVRQFPDDEQAPVALLRLAQGRLAAGDLDGALQAAGQLRDQYGAAPSAAGAYLLEARVLLAGGTGQGDLREARSTLNRIPALFDRAAYPDGRWRQASGMRRGRLSVLLDDLDLAAAEFVAVIEDETLSGATADAQIELASVFGYQARWAAAGEILQRVADGHGAIDADSAERARAVAQRRLSLLHRSVFRPLVGQTPWTAVRRLQVPGRGLRDPIGIAVADGGSLVVADEGTDLALTFNAAGELIATTTGRDLRLPWWGNDGRAYVLDRRVVQVPLSGMEAVSFEVPDGNDRDRLEDLRAGTRGPLGDWIMLDSDRRTVVRFDSAGQYVATLVDRRGDEEIVDLDVDGRGRIWMLDRDAKQVLRFALDGTAEGAVVSRDWRRPEALAVDALGNVYVLDRDAKTVDVFGSDGALTATVGPVLPDGTELRGPRDVSVDGAGRLYIVDRNWDTVFILE